MADPVRLIQGGRLPELDTLASKTDAELNLLLRRFGLDTDRAQRLEDAVVRATSQLQRAGRPSAAVIERATRQAESAVRRELMQLSKETLRAYEAQKRGDVAMLVWISVLDDSTCSDCEALHGEEHTPAENHAQPRGVRRQAIIR